MAIENENDPRMTQLWATYEQLIKNQLSLDDRFIADGNYTDADAALVRQTAERAINQAYFANAQPSADGKLTRLNEDGALSNEEKELIEKLPIGETVMGMLNNLPHKDLTEAQLIERIIKAVERIIETGGTVPELPPAIQAQIPATPPEPERVAQHQAATRIDQTDDAVTISRLNTETGIYHTAYEVARHAMTGEGAPTSIDPNDAQALVAEMQSRQATLSINAAMESMESDSMFTVRSNDGRMNGTFRLTYDTLKAFGEHADVVNFETQLLAELAGRQHNAAPAPTHASAAPERVEPAANDIAPPPPPAPPPAYMLRTDATSNLQAVMSGTLTDEARIAIDGVGNQNGVFEAVDMNALPTLAQRDPAALAHIANLVRRGGETPSPANPALNPASHNATRPQRNATDPAIVHQNAMERAAEEPAHVQVNRVNTDIPANRITPPPAAPGEGASEQQPAETSVDSETPQGTPPRTAEEQARENALVEAHNLVLNAAIANDARIVGAISGLSNDGNNTIDVADIYAVQALSVSNPDELLRIAAMLVDNNVTSPSATDAGTNVSAEVAAPNAPRFVAPGEVVEPPPR